MVNREIFLKKHSLEEALDIWQCVVKTLIARSNCKEEEISVFNSVGRISSREVISKLSFPAYNASAVDGFAIHSSDTFGADVRNPKELVIGIDALPVNTGDPLPYGFDSIAMIEEVSIVDGTTDVKKQQPEENRMGFSHKNIADFEIIKVPLSIAPYKNVRMIGDDFSAGDTIVHPNERIRPEHLAIMLAGGVKSLFVKSKPVVCIIPTGEEIKPPFEEISIGDIFDTNSYMVKAIVEDVGGIAYITQILPNDEKQISRSIQNNFETADIVVIVGGSAKGTKDLVSRVLASLGKVLVHGLSIQPGKPLLIGTINDKPVLGLPGFPVSCYLDAHLFLKKAIEILIEPTKNFGSTEASILRPIPSSIGVKEFIRVKIGNVNGNLVAVPLKKGAGVLSSITDADGIFPIPENLEGIESGTKIKIDLLRPKDYVDKQLLFIGSNDPLLNGLFDFIAKRNPDFRVGVVNAGSLGGLLAMQRGECSISSLHLFDDNTGTYNKPFLDKYITKEVLIVKFSLRRQGFIVSKGNPKNIKSVKDLARANIRFVNRQRGSGTRVLLDYLLKKNKIDWSMINGYEYEEYTHLGVANAVKLGNADCGLGIEYVANMFNLDFVNIKDEEYDLIILKDELRKENVRLLLDTISMPDFKNFAATFRGYVYRGELK